MKHQDIRNSPQEWLSGGELLGVLIRLIDPISDNRQRSTRISVILNCAAQLASCDYLLRKKIHTVCANYLDDAPQQVMFDVRFVDERLSDSHVLQN